MRNPDFPPSAPRLVVTGDNAAGQGGIVSDSAIAGLVDTPLFSSVEIWQTDSVPAKTTADSTLGAMSLEPPVGGVVVRMVTIPPDVDAATSGMTTGDALAEIGGSDAAPDDGALGVHTTETIDVITVISGELYAVLDTGETLLRPGDSLIQRGTAHAWSNRTAEPATFMATMYSAER